MSSYSIKEIAHKDLDWVSGGRDADPKDNKPANFYESLSGLVSYNGRNITVFAEGAAIGVTIFAICTLGRSCFGWVFKNKKRVDS